MARIPENVLDQLKAAGLLVSEPFPAGHVAYPAGVIVAKPASVPGNSLFSGDEMGYWGPSEIRIDSYGVCLHSDGLQWFVTSHDWIPGPGPGDFVDAWPAAEEAIADILDFFFGDPARMNAKRQSI